MLQNNIASSDTVNNTVLAQNSQEQTQNSSFDTITSLELVKQINLFRNQEIGKSELEHKNLLEVIRDEFEEEISQLKIQPSEYKSNRGQIYPMFILTFEQAKQVLARESKVVRKAVFEYIKNLENKIKSLASQKDVLYAKLFSKDMMEVVNAHKQLVALEVKPLLEKIEEDKPMVSYARDIAISINTIQVGEFAKLLPIEWDLGEKNLYKLLREKGVCLDGKIEWNKPAQTYLKSGYFEIEQNTYLNPKTNNRVSYRITKITGKGQLWISNKLKKWGYE